MESLIEYAESHEDSGTSDRWHDMVLDEIIKKYKAKSHRASVFKEVKLIREGYDLGDIDVLVVFPRDIHVVEAKFYRGKEVVDYDKIACQLNMARGFLEQEFGVDAKMFAAYRCMTTKNLSFLNYDGLEFKASRYFA